MTNICTVLLLVPLILAASGCASLEGGPPPGPLPGSAAADVTVPEDPVEVAAVIAGAGRGQALPAARRTAEDFDTTSAAERIVAVAAAAQEAPERRLGATVASLGDAADPGLWLSTPLVSSPGPGRLSYGKAGTSVLVELRPSGGAAGSGSRASLAALRLLEAPLAGLAELDVYAR